MATVLLFNSLLRAPTSPTKTQQKHQVSITTTLEIRKQDMELQFQFLLSLFHPLIFIPLILLQSTYLYFSFNLTRVQTGTTLKSYPLLGNLPQFLANRHRLLDWIAETLAASPTATFLIRRPRTRGVFTSNPANVEHILKSHFDNFPKGGRFTSNLEDFLGHGIFNSDGSQWKLQRKTASLEFNTRSLHNFVVDVVHSEIQTRLLPLLLSASASETTLDLQDVFEKFAFDNVCRLAFDFDPKCLEFGADTRFASAFREATNLSSARFFDAVPELWKVKKFLGIGSEKRLAKAIATVHGFATEIIRSRKNETNLASSHHDLLSRFIAAGDFSGRDLRDIVISFVLAGRDTTSSSLSWFFWLLSLHPEVEQKILAELRQTRLANPTISIFGFEELKHMEYLHAAISESLRLYPPVAVNRSQCIENDVLPDGTEVKKGWFAAYSSYAMGRMETIWGKDCKEYRPERWLDGDGKFRPVSPFIYPVFHAGPRVCLGKEMAYIQMKSVAASVLEKFKVEVLGKEERPEQIWSLTLRMKHGLPVKLRERATIKGY